jgi:S1-C subfamily serine protease
MKRIQIVIAILILISMGTIAIARDLNTIMMEATCKITGQASSGTGFVIGKPDEKNPPKAFYILVTADHVLRAAQGERVKLTFRQKQADNTWRRMDVPLQIREKKKELWQKHPDVDVAAIFVRLPTNVVTTLLSTDLLVDDEKINEYEIHPGQELLCLGYPFGAEANAQGFPILRSGRIASYPITPAANHKTFLFDFTVFRGNSGGPVYFVQHDPTYGGKRRIGTTIYGVIGIVIRERNITQKIQELYEKTEKVTPLQLGEVIHATFIKELIDSMDRPKD